MRFKIFVLFLAGLILGCSEDPATKKATTSTTTTTTTTTGTTSTGATTTGTGVASTSFCNVGTAGSAISSGPLIILITSCSFNSSTNSFDLGIDCTMTSMVTPNIKDATNSTTSLTAISCVGGSPTQISVSLSVLPTTGILWFSLNSAMSNVLTFVK